MLLVTAAIIEKNGLILAARRKPGCHMAGYWEFPGGKVEAAETNEDCLVRELSEEFGIQCKIGAFFGDSIYDYGTKIVRLLAYRVQHLSGPFNAATMIDCVGCRLMNFGRLSGHQPICPSL